MRKRLVRYIRKILIFIMEETFWNDPQSKVGYIYDYMHDDQPDIKDHMTYENTIKTRIDVKLIVKSYSSLDQDQPEFYVNSSLLRNLSLRKTMSFIILKRNTAKGMELNFRLE